MADIVTEVLELPSTLRIAFSFGAVTVGNAGFKSVVDALAAGKITIVVNPKLGANTAVYSFKKNRFSFGFKGAAGNGDRESLVVHESVHAALDVSKSPLRVKQSEAAAYIAQCLYYYYRNESEFSGGRSPTFGDPILKAAWPVSQIVLTRAKLEDADVEPLFKAIAEHALYKGRADNTDDFDGV